MPISCDAVFYNPGSGVQFSPKDVGSEDIDSDVNSNGVTDVITVAEGDSIDTVNIGCYKLGRIGDFVFEDTNNNGLQDEGEPGVAGVEVILQNPDGTTVATTTTDSSGLYEFNRANAGEYKITFVRPDGFDGFATPNAEDDSLDSDVVDGDTGMTDVFRLNLGENKTDIDAGLVKTPTAPQTATLGDTVFDDANSNGIQDAGEVGVSGVTVILQDPNGGFVSAQATDANGQYLFDELNPGDYKITILNPGEFTGFSPQNAGTDDAIDSDIDPTNGMSDIVTLEAGETDLTLDGGLIKEPATPEKVDVDLAIATDGLALFDGKKDNLKLTPGSTWRQTITVTNNSNETATGVVASTTLQAGLDVWEPNQSQTEYNSSWVGSETAQVKERFSGNPATVDPTNGTVTVNDVSLAGIDPKKLDTKVEDLPGGELIWELGTPLAPGESATLTFYAQRTNFNTGGVEFHHNASIVNVDQHETNTGNNQDKIDLNFSTPIALDLNGDGIQTLSIDEGVEFDLLNTGVKVNTGWLSGEDALLAVDNNGNGQIDDRSELFGGAIGEGFAKLATFDSNDDGLVDANDADFGQLQVWQDANENGATDTGELIALDTAGVAALNTDYTNVFEMDAQGNIHGEHGSAALANGNTIDLVDVYFQVEV